MNSNYLKIELKILDQSVKIPRYLTIGAAGLDLHACVKTDLVLNPGQTELVPTGLAIYIAHSHYVGLIVPRSGLGHKHGIVLGNSIGVIDSDYQGEILVSLWNRGKKIYIVKPFERIAQIIFTSIMQATFDVVEDFSISSKRGIGGFGSTGIN